MSRTGWKPKASFSSSLFCRVISHKRSFFQGDLFFYPCNCALMLRKFVSGIISSISLLFAGSWLVIRIILEYFGIISDGNDRTTGIKDLREEYKKANYR
jgi:hypothetical protein